MSRGPENSFIDSIHRLLGPIAPGNYRMKNHNIYNGGVADVWYSGLKNDLWVEYKFIALPKRALTKINFGLTPLQLMWLRDRSEEGRNVWVIVGSKDGGWIYKDGGWGDGNAMLQHLLIDGTLTRKDIAHNIARFIN